MKLRSNKKSVKHAVFNLHKNKFYEIAVTNKRVEFYKLYKDIIKENLKNRYEIKRQLLMSMSMIK